MPQKLNDRSYVPLVVRLRVVLSPWTEGDMVELKQSWREVEKTILYAGVDVISCYCWAGERQDTGLVSWVRRTPFLLQIRLILLCCCDSFLSSQSRDA